MRGVYHHNFNIAPSSKAMHCKKKAPLPKFLVTIYSSKVEWKIPPEYSGRVSAFKETAGSEAAQQKTKS